jgi:hypothetical protein
VLPIIPDRKISYAREATAAALGVDPTDPAGCHHARRDEASIRALWTGDRANAWIGLAMGDGVLAVDIDEKNGKSGSATLTANGWTIPATATQHTRSGGWHYLVDVPPGARAATDNLADGIDRRGDGGHIVLYDPAMLTAERAPAPPWALAPGRPKADRLDPADVLRAPTYDVALDALRSRDPGDLGREEWLLLSGAFCTAVAGLVDDAVALADWQQWNLAHGETNDPAANGRAWVDFQRKGTGGDFQTLASMAARPDPAKAWAAFGPGPLAMPAGAKRAANDDPAAFFVRVADLVSSPPVFLIDSLIEVDALAAVFGDPVAGKSLVTIDMGASVATGEPFHGHAVLPGAVFYIAGEGKNGLRRRFDAWAELRGCSLSDAPLFVSRAAVQFLDAASGAYVTAAIDALAAAHGRPRLIVVDTLARNFGPGDENSTADMSAFVAALDKLRDRFPGCTVLLVHHSGHGEKDRGRGSSVLRGALDAEFKVAKSGESVTLSNLKMKDAPPPREMEFALVEAAGSVALEYTGEPSGTAGKSLTPTEQIALDAFNAVAVEGVASVEAWRTAFYERHASDKPDTKLKAFNRGRDGLVERQLLQSDDDGQNYSRPPMPGQTPQR